MFTKPIVELISSNVEGDYVCLFVECSCCGEGVYLGESYEGFREWLAGAAVQDAFTMLGKEWREMLISGTCPTCWAEMYAMVDSDDERC